MTIYTALLCSFSKFEPVSCSCKLLTIASWAACRFLRSHVKYSHIFKKCKNFPQFVVIHTVKGFSIVNEAEVDVFLEFPCFLYNPMNVDLISGSSAFSKPTLYIWKFSVIILLMLAWRILSITLLACKMCAIVVWTFFRTVLLWDGNENWSFPVLWPLLSFPNLLTYECSILTTSSFRIWNSSAGIPSPSFSNAS